jgi:hypothetical protein
MVKIPAFENIKTIDELILFLEDRAVSSDYIYQYTNLEALEGKLKNKFLVLGNVMNMNDLYEYKLSKATLRNRSYISCFSRDDNENIAMWAMYGNPWNKGVRIGFKSRSLRNLLKHTSEVYRVDDKFNLIESISFKPEEKVFSCVAYYKKSDHRLDWSNQRLYLSTLTGFDQLTTNPKLHGYIKHKAWSYENEVRMMIRLADGQEYDRIGIKLTDEIISEMQIMTGPSVSSYMKDKHKDLLKGRSENSDFEGLIKLKEIFKEKE